MKTNIYRKAAMALFSSAMLLTPCSFCSCSDYLDKEPDTELTTEMVFENRDKVYGWLANIYNMGIRNSILGREEQLTTGDLLMIVKNNYFWTAKDSDPASRQIQFLANGDRACVRRVRNIRSMYGFSFADVWLQLPDYDDYEIQATIIMDSLLTEAPALTREQSNILFNNVLEDYADIPTKPERMKRLREDMYYNSLQVKYAYAVTCHKAQGGQWAHIYIDQGYMTDDMLTPDYIHWLYTAFTRATEKLYLVNWPV